MKKILDHDSINSFVMWNVYVTLGKEIIVKKQAIGITFQAQRE